MSAILAFSPKFNPSDMPAPIAIMFLTVPPIPTPTISSDVYARKFSLDKLVAIFVASSFESDATP